MVPILCPPVLLSCMHLSTSYSTWNLNLMAGLIPSHFLISGDDSSFHREGPFSRHLFMLKTILLFPSLLIPIHSHFQIICFFCLCGWISEFYLSIPSTPTHGASISSAWLLSWPISGLGSPKFPWGSALVLGGKKKNFEVKQPQLPQPHSWRQTLLFKSELIVPTTMQMLELCGLLWDTEQQNLLFIEHFPCSI